MNILHIVPSMNPKQGGICQAVKTMSKGLTDRGIRNEILCFDQPNAVRAVEETVPVHPLGAGFGSWNYQPLYIHWLLENIIRFEVIILHGLWQYNGFGLQKALKIWKRKHALSTAPRLYLMPHGMLDPYFQRAPKRWVKALRNLIYWKRIEQHLVNGAEGLLFTSEEELLLAEKTFKGYAPKQKHVTGLGVDNPPLCNDAMPLAFSNTCPGLDAAPYFLFLGRIHPKKGIDDLLKAYSQLLENYHTRPVPAGTAPLPKLVIAGPGMDSPYGHKISRLIANTAGLKSNVFFTGMLQGDAKWGAFYGCEAFVLPSHQENFGIAVIEALACHKAVLISSQVNIWREIEEDKACLVAEDTIAGIHQLLKGWIARSSFQKEQMKDNARRCFEKNFSVTGAADRLLRAINYPSSQTNLPSALETEQVLHTNLSAFSTGDYQNGSLFKIICWSLISCLFFDTVFPWPYAFKTILLRMFGAKAGMGLVIKTKLRIKNPWRFTAGDHCWIGESVWIDNLENVVLGNHVCLSQGAMLLTGNHDYTRIDFPYRLGKITLEDGVWIGAQSVVCPGVSCKSHSVLTVNSVATNNLQSWGVYCGNPAVFVRVRAIQG